MMLPFAHFIIKTKTWFQLLANRHPNRKFSATKVVSMKKYVAEKDKLARQSSV